MGRQALFLIGGSNRLFLCNTIPSGLFDRQSHFTVQGLPRPFIPQLGYLTSGKTKEPSKMYEIKWEPLDYQTWAKWKNLEQEFKGEWL